LKKNILTLWDLSEDDYLWLIRRTSELKNRRKQGVVESSLAGKTLGLLFEKPSTRTRISFEAAICQLGGSSIFISMRDTQLSRNEPIADTARVLSGYLDAIAIRSYSQDLIEQMAQYSEIPIINALSDLYHPCQILSDIYTVAEHIENFQDLKYAWIGDGNNMANSWINVSAILGLSLTIACPKDYSPNPDILDTARKQGKGKIHVTTSPIEAVKDANVINTDVWASMGQEHESDERKEIFVPYQVNKDLLTHAAPNAMILHCLPAHRGEEITDDVIEGPHSFVWTQAENKLHMHKAILEMLIQ